MNKKDPSKDSSGRGKGKKKKDKKSPPLPPSPTRKVNLINRLPGKADQLPNQQTPPTTRIAGVTSLRRHTQEAGTPISQRESSVPPLLEPTDLVQTFMRTNDYHYNRYDPYKVYQ